MIFGEGCRYIVPILQTNNASPMSNVDVNEQDWQFYCSLIICPVRIQPIFLYDGIPFLTNWACATTNRHPLGTFPTRASSLPGSLNDCVRVLLSRFAPFYDLLSECFCSLLFWVIRFVLSTWLSVPTSRFLLSFVVPSLCLVLSSVVLAGCMPLFQEYQLWYVRYRCPVLCPKYS